jgi:hypothetical protein
VAKQQSDPSIDTLPREMGNPARSALALEGYTRLEQLDGVSEKYLAKLHGVGPAAIKRLKAALAAQGLALAD